MRLKDTPSLPSNFAPMTEGKLIIFSAPSGAGKTTIVRSLLEQGLPLAFSVSATSRPSREGEEHGRDYWFLSADEFRERIAAGDFLEWEEVYEGQFYGTLRSEVNRFMPKDCMCFSMWMWLAVSISSGSSRKRHWPSS
jgi:guanylate kinase